jgi:hypothetical protein
MAFLSEILLFFGYNSQKKRGQPSGLLTCKKAAPVLKTNFNRVYPETEHSEINRFTNSLLINNVENSSAFSYFYFYSH